MALRRLETGEFGDCLDCGEPMALEMKDGQVLSADPAGIFGYTPEALGGPPDGRPHR